jgi:paraquat-inducible protein A
MIFIPAAKTATSAAQPEFKVIIGEWVRYDGDYTIRVRDVKSDGSADVGYFNPGEINVAERSVSLQKGLVKLFVKLQDRGYPGSTAVWERIKIQESTRGIPVARANPIGCHTCHLLCRSPSHGGHGLTCPRCGTHLHRRKPDSIARTWSLILAAAILYIPANVLPITIVTSLGKKQADTIISGVIYFISSGMWPIALVIFVASVFVPLLKLLALGYLSFSVQRKSVWRPVDRTKIYRMAEVVGRWSMVDVYVVTILVAMVNLGALATIEAGPAAVYFCGVVITTMFAAMSFDPRLIWDNCEENHE